MGPRSLELCADPLEGFHIRPAFAANIIKLVIHTGLALSLYANLASLVLASHATYLLWVIFGAFIAVRRPVLRWIHIVSLIWGILTELTPWPCPLTLLENWLESRAGVQPYQGGFLLHYLDKLVYPDISPVLLTALGVIVCAANLAIYAALWRRTFGGHKFALLRFR